MPYKQIKKDFPEYKGEDELHKHHANTSKANKDMLKKHLGYEKDIELGEY